MNKLVYLPFNRLKPVLEQEALEKAIKLFNKKHSVFLHDEFFDIEHGVNGVQIQITVTLKKADGSFAYPLEILHMYDAGNKEEIFYMLLDYIDSYWTEYLSGGRDVYVPIDWSEHNCDEVKFFLRGFVRNIELEAMADAFLSEHGFGDCDRVRL